MTRTRKPRKRKVKSNSSNVVSLNEVRRKSRPKAGVPNQVERISELERQVEILYAELVDVNSEVVELRKLVNQLIRGSGGHG